MNGADFKELLKMAAPVVGTLAAGDGVAKAEFAQAFEHGRRLARQEKEQKRLLDERRGQGAGRFLMDIGSHAERFDDPIALDQFLRTAGDAYEMSGFGSSSDIVGRFTVPESKSTAKLLKQLTDQLDAMERDGYDLDQLAKGGAHLTVGDQSIPVSSAIDLTRKRPIDPAGKPIPKPKKPPTKTGTIDERAAGLLEEIDAATTAGDAATAAKKKAEYDRLLKAKRELSDASRAPGDPDVAAIRKSILELQEQILRDKATGPSGVGGSGLSRDVVNAAGGLRDDFRNETKDYRTVREAYERVLSSAKDPSPAGDLALLFAYMKALDPGSVVRESEFANAARAGSLPTQIQAAANKVINGQRLTADQRADFVSRAKGLFARADQRQKKTADKYRSIATRSGIPADLVIVDDADLGAIEDPAAPDVATLTREQLLKRRKSNGPAGR